MPKPSHSGELRWFFLEALGQEECHVTLRMLILTSKFLKEPFNRTSDLFPLLLNGKYSSLIHCERYLIFPRVFPLFSDYHSTNAIDLENNFLSFLIEMNFFN